MYNTVQDYGFKAGTAGVPVIYGNPHLDNVAATATNNIVNAQATSSTAVTTITSFLAQPDAPRNLIITPGGTTADVAACNITVEGTDLEGTPISELFAFTANQSTGTVGVKAFNTITKITIPAQDGSSATFSVGFGEAFGLPTKLSLDTVLRAWVGTTIETTLPTVVTSTSELAKNLVTFDTAPDGSNDYRVLYIPH